MIRRDVSHATRWVLISQVDHARLSGELARHWGAGGVAPLADRDELLWAIAHHDDGWSEWERAPGVDAACGRPRSFTEMELPESLAIWSRSISLAAERGPLAGYAVAGHFCALLRRFGSAWKSGGAAASDAARFLARHESLIDECFRVWQARSPQDNTAQRAGLALAQLQFFDSLSLWFCCAEATEPDELPTPAGPPIVLRPPAPRSGDGPLHVTCAPWPLTVARLNFEVPGREIPVAHYASRQALAAAPAQSVVLRWVFEPQPAREFDPGA